MAPKRNGDPIHTVELTLALEMISSMSFLAVVTFSPAHLSRLMLPRQNFWKLSPSPPPPPPPPSALSGAPVSWPLLRRFGYRIQRACLGQKPCLKGYMLRAIGKWNAMALDLRRGLKNLDEDEGESPRLVVDCCELRRLPIDWESLPWI